MDLDLDQTWSYYKSVISENLSKAKAKLSSLVNAALAGEDVTICKDGVPAVKLVPILLYWEMTRAATFQSWPSRPETRR